jgi:MFS family permease
MGTALDAPGLSFGWTKTQWLVCAIASLGFAFDLYEALMTALIVRPVVSSLGGLPAGSSEFNLWVGLFFSAPAVIGGVFGLFGGYLSDRVGRRRVLVWTILLYASSALLAGFANSLPVLLALRCTTWIGVSVEHVAAVAWVAELFPHARQRERALGYTQAAFGLGGLMVTGAYYLAVTYGHRWPAIHGSHDAWRYTLLSGVIPAIPLIVARPFLPESPVWLARRHGHDSRLPHIAALFQPALRKTTLVATLLVACCFALPYGAVQHTPRVMHGLFEVQSLSPVQIEQTVSHVQLVQELGGLSGRLLFAVLITHIVVQRHRLRVLLIPAVFVFPWLFFFAETRSLALLTYGVFAAQVVFNGLISFWGNYLPRVYPTHLRVTGESFAVNIGGRAIGVSTAFITTTLSNSVWGGSATARLAHAAGIVATSALVIGLIASQWLHEPESDRLPD